MLVDQKKIVLIVDDEEPVRQLERIILERAGYRVLLAGSSQEALVMSRGHLGQIDLLLSDVDMPGMNGIALCRQIAADRPGTAVLLNSGNPCYEEEVGFPFLAKPFTPEKLQMSVAEVLAGQPQAVAQAKLAAVQSLPAANSSPQPQIPHTQWSYAPAATVQTGFSSDTTRVQAEQHCAHVLPQPERRLPETVVPIRKEAVREIKPRSRAARLVPMWAAAAALVIAMAPFGVHQIKERMVAKPYTVNLQAVRGPAGGAEAPTGQPLVLNLDVTNLPRGDSYKIQIVNEAGDDLWQGVALAQGSEIHSTAAALRPGVYFVRVYKSAGELLKEYQLHVTRTR